MASVIANAVLEGKQGVQDIAETRREEQMAETEGDDSVEVEEYITDEEIEEIIEE